VLSGCGSSSTSVTNASDLFNSWFVILAPTGTPRGIVARLNSEVLNALTDPATRHRLHEQGLVVGVVTDVVRQGKPVVGHAFTLTTAMACPVLAALSSS
jgi:hypothetical protein